MNREEGTFQRMTNDPTQPFAPGTNIRIVFRQPTRFTKIVKGVCGLALSVISNIPHICSDMIPLQKSLRYFLVQSFAWQVFESNDGTIWVAGAGASGRNWKIKPKQKAYDLLPDLPFQEAFYKSALSRKVTANIVESPPEHGIDPLQALLVPIDYFLHFRQW